MNFIFFSVHFVFGGTNENKPEKLVARIILETKNVMFTGQRCDTVSWDSKKIFGSGGVSVMGVFIDPNVQFQTKS